MTDWIWPEGLTDAVASTHAGFVYQITHKVTGKAYIGKKSFHAIRKRKRMQSDWRRYFGSSAALKADIKLEGKDAYRREILSVHASKRDLTYAETEAQFVNQVLTARLRDGSYRFHNLNILGRFFRPRA